MSQPTRSIKLTRPEISHLLDLLARNKDDGIYSGMRDQYWNRARRVTEKLVWADFSFTERRGGE